MTWWIILGAFGLMLLDYCFGSYYLPGKTGVVKHKNQYYVYKWHRCLLFFIPSRKWLCSNYIRDNSIQRFRNVFCQEFTGYRQVTAYEPKFYVHAFRDKEEAIRIAKIFANKLGNLNLGQSADPLVEVWNSKQNDEENDTVELGLALERGDMETAKRIHEKVKLY